MVIEIWKVDVWEIDFTWKPMVEGCSGGKEEWKA